MLEMIQIIRIDEQAKGVIRLMVPRAESRAVMGPGISEVRAIVAAQGMAHSGAWFTHHFRKPAENFDFEVGVAVSGLIADEVWLRPGLLPASTVANATSTHRSGPFSDS